ncbi:MAG: hypothetical protein EXR95_06565, partial [Gemmatimonadetes bacterium]|nr:hypothetical protein [Gemmatimonadota bacterium]
MADRTEMAFLEGLQRRGARRLKRVTFRRNRRTIWSLSGAGAVLNLHEGYREAPPSVLDAFAVIVRDATRDTAAYREASQRVRDWSGLEPALRRARDTYQRLRQSRRRPAPSYPGPCCATAEQKRYLRRLYLYLNDSRFDGRLPLALPLRLSNRFTSRLGQMVPGLCEGRREVLEIALNVDLMLRGNGRERLDTLVHEMAHAADWLFSGGEGHGPTWRSWARHAGCQTVTCTSSPIVQRVDRTVPVRRV